MKFTPTEILEQYPNIQVKGFNKMHVMDGDLICTSESGRIILVTEASVIEKKSKGKIWNELEIKKFTLIDDER